ncbi:hypothetical protein V5O48_001901 [Marasmius crinis-equi]|uniref:Adenylosuccinate lyase C-terminal domain-containing protein n=1 Tax=Marasmius crinis-equi TaxID=585013 RepID=A0ABR3FXY5_9AGAR
MRSFIVLATAVSSTLAAVTRTGSTINLADNAVPIPGNECITFRNNGEIVEAACVAAAVDRQVTPGTLPSGQAVLFVERQFGQAQAARLVGKEPCVGFNGTHFRAEDCNALSANQIVTLDNQGQLVAGAACSSGVNRAAEMTVAVNGGNCATYKSTVVQRTLDNAGTPAPAAPAAPAGNNQAATPKNNSQAATPNTNNQAATPKNNNQAAQNPNQANAGNGATPAAPAGGNAAVTRNGDTLVLADDAVPIPGNECITFRNNGEMVEAACVNTAVDRQITPGTTASGQSVLFVERQFGAAQAARLVGVQPCVGFNGTHFRAEDCNAFSANGVQAVTFENGQLVVAGTQVCSNGVDRAAQLTVSLDGTGCATFTGTTVQRTLDNAGTPAKRTEAFARRIISRITGRDETLASAPLRIRSVRFALSLAILNHTKKTKTLMATLGSVSVYDSIFRTIFTNEEIRAVFSDRAYVSRCIDAEVALAKAEAALNVIPAEAAQKIAEGCHEAVDKLDWDRLQHDAEIVGYPILGLVRQLDKLCGESGKYIHWGATTQDIMDTASVLQIKSGLDIISRQLTSVRTILVRLAKKYRDAPMAGRTHLQHALPATFGYKCAVWLSSLDRQAEHLEQLKSRVLLVQFGGAAGTLASLGNDDTGVKVRAKMADELGLYDPPISWHVARDGIAECVSFLSILGGSLGKVALDLLLLSSSEFGEVQEPFVPHRGASSTMPQKRNSISSEVILACSKLLRQHAATAQDAMVSDLERASGPWHLEWSCVPEAFCAASGALKQAEFVLDGIVVDANRMLQNLDMSKGLIVGEAVMMGLAPSFGRNGAHDIVYEACIEQLHESGEQGRLADKLKSMPQVVEKMGETDIDRLCDPKNYLGSCGRMVDQVVGNRSSG